jgi:hypothetical protein
MRTAALALIGVAMLSIAACDRSENQRAKADVVDATRTAGQGLDRAAAATQDTVDDLSAQAKPAADKAARDTKLALDKMAIAAGRATRKAGDRLEQAGDRAKEHVSASDHDQRD